VRRVLCSIASWNRLQKYMRSHLQSLLHLRPGFTYLYIKFHVVLYAVLYENGHEQLFFSFNTSIFLMSWTLFLLRLVIFWKHFLQDAKRNYNSPPYATLSVCAWLDNHFVSGSTGRWEPKRVSSVWFLCVELG
jgi:hypothetical protein